MNLKRPAARPAASRSLVTALIATTTVVLGLFATLLAAGCGNDHQNNARALQGREWRAVKIAGVTPVLPFAKGAATATFEDGRITGSGTVNRFFGSYELGPANAIRIFEIGATEMAGPPEAMAQETAYFEALQQATVYQITESSLVLLGKDGSLLVEFEVVPPAPLTGTPWRAAALGAEPADPDTPVTDLKITALFGTDGTLTGNASVNQYSTAYTVSDGGKMAVGTPIATTKMAGPPELMAVEAAYLAALPRVASYEIEGNILWLRDAAGTDLVRFTTD